MAKIQRAYRIEESLVREMDKIIKKLPKVSYTDIIEAALKDLLEKDQKDVIQLIAHHILGSSVADDDIPF